MSFIKNRVFDLLKAISALKIYVSIGYNYKNFDLE
jgi:hypothetical protein